jgi:hypothetical protein
VVVSCPGQRESDGEGVEGVQGERGGRGFRGWEGYEGCERASHSPRSKQVNNINPQLVASRCDIWRADSPCSSHFNDPAVHTCLSVLANAYYRGRDKRKSLVDTPCAHSLALKVSREGVSTRDIILPLVPRKRELCPSQP